MIEQSRKSREKSKALKSGDPNRILWLYYRSAARALFQHSLNVTTALTMSDRELLRLKGIGKGVLESLKKAVKMSAE